MKLGLWILIVAVTTWSIDADHWISQAFGATTTTTTTSTRTSITTASDSSVTTVIQTFTSTNVTTTTETTSSTAISTQPNPNQTQAQDNTKDLNKDGADQATALGLAAIAAGMAMVATGMALMANPPTAAAGAALVAAGMALIAAGMAALAAAAEMQKNEQQAANNATNMNCVASDPQCNYKSVISTDSSSSTYTSTLGDVQKIDLGNGNTSGIKIDPALLRTGKLDTIMGDMEQKTGLSRDDLLNGNNPLSTLAGSPAMKGTPGSSADSLQKMMDDTLAKGNIPNGQEVMDKLGLEAADLKGGGASRGLASAAPNIDSLFPNKEGPGGPAGGNGDLKLSSELQAALDKNGITGRSIFEMVHSQYVRKTPLMFGVQQSKSIGADTNNPYTGLGGEKVDF